jgi:hypothetical protein
MTRDEFIEAIKDIPFELLDVWTRNPSHIMVRVKGGCDCPIIALAKDRGHLPKNIIANSMFMNYGQQLGLANQDITLIAHIADGWYGGFIADSMVGVTLP